MRGVQRPVAPARITTGSRLGVAQARGVGSRPIGPRPFGQRNPWITPAFRHHFRFNIFFGHSCFGSFFDPFFCRQFFFPNHFFVAQPVFIPYPVYATPYYDSVAEPPTPTVPDRESDLAAEIGRLKEEVELLRGEEASREQARQAAAPPPPVKENEPTVLVFRDGHQSEIRNYAIVGQTLWALTERRARKIPLSDLNVEGTKKVNAGRGVEMRVP